MRLMDRRRCLIARVRVSRGWSFLLELRRTFTFTGTRCFPPLPVADPERRSKKQTGARALTLNLKKFHKLAPKVRSGILPLARLFSSSFVNPALHPSFLVMTSTFRFIGLEGCLAGLSSSTGTFTIRPTATAIYKSRRPRCSIPSDREEKSSLKSVTTSCFSPRHGP